MARISFAFVGASPQLDLLTEPRWPRGTGIFGSDPQLASILGGAYVAGFPRSTDGVRANGVMAVVKHWVGYGAEINGFDAHTRHYQP